MYVCVGVCVCLGAHICSVLMFSAAAAHMNEDELLVSLFSI